MKKMMMIAAAVAGVVQMASAQIVPPSPTTPGLILENGASTVIGTYDGGGAWSFIGTVGTYALTVTTGDVIQGGDNPILDLDVDVTSAGTGALYVIFTGGSFGPSTGTYSLSTSAYNSTGGTISSYAYLNSTSLGGSADSTSHSVVNAAGSISATSYYLSLEDVVNGGVVSADSTLATAVPEASTVMAGMLMILPLGIGAFRALRKERMA